MSSFEKKRTEFRKYLEDAGAIDNLTQALIKLYEQKKKPSDAVKFIRKNMCSSCPDDEQFEVLTSDLERASKRICELERELSRLKGIVKRTESEVHLALTKGFDELDSDQSCSLLKKFMTLDIIEKLRVLKTSFKGTLLDCVQSGLEILDSPIGVYACDPDAYCVYSPLLDQLIEELHGFKRDDKHPALDWGEACKLTDVDPTGEFIISSQVSCSRSVKNYPFAAIMNMDQYEEIMDKVQARTKCMGGELKGKFYALEGMDQEMKKSLVDENILFKEDNHPLKAANGTRFWPTGRGIFLNDAKTFAIWCNEEDHLRFISMDQGGNLRDIYDRLMTGVTQVTKDIPVVFDERLGFLNFSPSNLGNAIQASVQLKLEKLPMKEAKLDELAENFGLKITKLSDDLYEVSSSKRLGFTEFETVKEFSDAVVELVNVR